MNEETNKQESDLKFCPLIKNVCRRDCVFFTTETLNPCDLKSFFVGLMVLLDELLPDSEEDDIEEEPEKTQEKLTLQSLLSFKKNLVKTIHIFDKI
ncbi:MAG: hypothetical protein ACTSVS_09330 [Candidatus Heimdallarchaeota archaeon]